MVHLASVVATLAGAGAIVAILWSMVLDGSRSVPLVALTSLVLTTPLLLLSVGVDGFAIKSIADRWAHAGGGDRDLLLAAGTAVRSVDVGLLNLVMIGQFGLTAILLGVACWTSAVYGKPLGLIAVAAGTTGGLCGTLQAVSGRLTTVSYLGLLTVSLGLFTVWLILASFALWRRAPDLVPGTRPTSVARQ